MNNPPPPSKVNAAVPAGLSDLVMKLLEKDPARRIGSAHEVAEALRELERGVQTTQATAAVATSGTGFLLGRARKPVPQEARGQGQSQNSRRQAATSRREKPQTALDRHRRRPGGGSRRGRPGHRRLLANCRRRHPH